MFPTPILAEIKNLNPNRVHDGGGYAGGGISHRGSNRNLLDSYMGNSMGHVTVKQIFCNGRFASIVWK